jgi:hypothetical protein
MVIKHNFNMSKHYLGKINKLSQENINQYVVYALVTIDEYSVVKSWTGIPTDVWCVIKRKHS